MNDPFVHEQSAGFARRLLSARSDDGERIKLAYRMALGREADDEELGQGLNFLAGYRRRLAADDVAAERQAELSWAAYARTLLIRNEFLFVE